MQNFPESLKKALRSLRNATRTRITALSVQALKSDASARLSEKRARLREKLAQLKSAALRKASLFAPENVAAAWKRQELAGGFLITFFALAIVLGMAAKVVAVNTVTIGYDDHRVRDYGTSFDFIAAQDELADRALEEPEAPENTGPMCYPE